MAIRMQQRRGTATQWTSADPVLATGEIGFESDTGKFKIGNGSSSWSALSYFADASDFDTTAIESTIDSKVATAINNLLDGAPSALNTLNEIADAIDNDSSFATTMISALALKADQTDVIAHHNATSNIHGIADTSELATKEYADDTANTKTNSGVLSHNNTSLNVHGIPDTAELATKTYAENKANAAQSSSETFTTNYVGTAISTHSAVTTDIHGIANTAELATKTYADTVTTNGINTHKAVTTNVHGITDTSLLATKSYADTAASSSTSTHNSTTTNVHGIADTANLVLTNDSRLSNTRTPTDASVTTAKIAAGGIAQSAVTNLTTDLAAKATLASPAFTGVPTAPTASAGTNTTQIATTAYVRGEVSALIASAPGALDTLNELATALGNDANFATTVTNALATKASTTDLNNATLYSFANKTSSYTLALSDSTNMVEMDSASSTTVTVPTNASVAFPIGATVDIFQKNTGQVTIAAASGVTIYATPGLKLRAQYSGATLIKRDTNTWILTGDLSA